MSLPLRQRLPLQQTASLIFLALLFTLTAGILPAAAATVEWNWRSDASLRDIGNAADLMAHLADHPWSTEVGGRPEMPLYSVSLAIPAGERVSSLRLVDPITDRIALSAPLDHFQGIEDEHGRSLSLTDDGRGRFPADHLHAHASFRHRGHASAEVVLAPLLYEESDEGVVIHRLRGATIVVETEADPGARLPLRQRARDIEFSRSVSASRVVNHERVASFAPQCEISETGGLFAPRSLPSVEGSGVDLVIVCDAAHKTIFDSLADFKLSMGYATVVRDIDWIRANYPQGADLQETIRFFLQDAYEKWGISYVILAGDTDIVPARYVHSYFKDPPEDIPADLYYAQLDGNWNGNGDQWFGESNYGGKEGDDVDMVADIHLGRLPVRDSASAQLMVDKIVAYSSQPDTSYCRNVSYYAEVLFPASWQPGDPDEWITRNGADYAQYIYDNYQPGQIDATRFYETYWLYPGSVQETVADVLYDLENRAHITHHVGHGYRYTMSVGDGSIVANDMLNLNNGLDHLFTMYALNCTSCAIDYNCLAEAVLLAENGGGISMIGTMREAFPNTSIYYQNSYFSTLFGDSLSLGEVFTISHNNWASLGVIEGSHRWTQMSYLLIGDPTINVWMDTPLPLNPVVTQTYDLSSDTLKVQVSRDALPLEGARVIARKSGEDWAEGLTDAAGMVHLPFHAESTGDIDISVTNRNDLPAFATYAVAAGSGERLSVALLAVEDDSGAGVVGNADGNLDAGESVRLDLRVHNRGGSAVSNLGLDLLLPGAELAVVESNVATGLGLAAGDSLDVSAAFLLDAPLDLGDGLNVVFEVTLTHDGGSEQDSFDVPTRAPLPRLFTFTVNDDTGDGDGEPDAGENYALIPEWKNYGSTPIDGWTATMSAVDPNGQVLSGAVSLPVMNLLERGFSAGFDLLETDVASPNRFLLSLAGPLGGAWSDTITVRRPGAPTELLLNSSIASTIIDVAWPIPDGEPAGYMVYRSEASGGPYTEVTSEPTRHAIFRNDGLDESTTYFFVVETVDSCGYRSTWSSEGSVSTNPAMMSGWPLQTGQGTASSVVSGDIDGDGDKELVAGSDFIYAWHHDGVEVLDGDADSGTYGVLSPDGGVFTAAVALADVDPSFPGDEIIAASTVPYGIYVYHGDGTLVSGWPVSMPHWCWGTPAVADMDGDEELEIFAMCLNGNLYAWNADGSEFLSGSGGVFATGLGGWCRSSPSLANIDGDPELEVVIGSSVNSLNAYNHDGSPVSGFPVSFSHPIFSSVSLGDLDGDYDLEIAFICENDSLYVLEHDGSRRTGFPTHLQSNAPGLAPSPALVDFEGDGQFEIVAAGVYSTSSSYVTVVDNQGNTLPGWPVHLEDSSEASPVVADLDEDDQLEILLGTENRYFYAWELDGSAMAGFPILTGAELRSCPTVDDLDGDLTVDVALMGWDSFVYVWDMPAFYKNGLAHWRMFRANPARTGVFTPEVQVVVTEETASAVPEGKLFANYPNPFNPSTRIRFATPAGDGKLPVNVTVHDIRGRRIRTLHEGALPRGIVHSLVWDGKTDGGSAVASGVYFARAEMEGREFSQKMVLLK